MGIYNMTRKMCFKYVSLLLISSLLCSCTPSNSEKNVSLEKAKYTVLEKSGSIEIRQYQPCIVAETLVDADFNKAGNIAFYRLFDYIRGKNRGKESIAMTAPVTQAPASEKIAMTAPVTQQKSADKFAVSFVMPSKYTMDTLPQPLDANVILKQVPAFKAAAIRYSGTWSKKRYDAREAELKKFIQDKNLKAAGEPVWARYDPPFQIFFLRRNEVLIPIE
jgi:hypothetical protein